MDILSIRPLGDTAFTMALAQDPGPEATGRVGLACAILEAAQTRGDLPGLVELAGAFRSVTFHYQPLVTSQDQLVAAIRPLLSQAPEPDGNAARVWELPCLFADAVAPDLKALEDTLNLDRAQIIRTMTDTPLQVHALGFLPGLPFMGDLPETLGLPRRAEPRARVPAGSVAIANRQCVIYPWESPGGWHILGRCPVPLFDINQPRPALLASGDRVHLRAVEEEEFDSLQAEARTGRLDPARFRLDKGEDGDKNGGADAEA